MPHITIHDVTGVAYSITSSDNETVGRWLVETLTLCTSPNPAYSDIRIRVNPLWVGTHDAGAWDWHPKANQTFVTRLAELTPIGNIRCLARAMEHYADEVEAEAGRV